MNGMKSLMHQSHWAPGTPRFTPVHEPGSTGGWTVVPPWWTGMMPDGPGGLSGGFWHVKNHRGEPWRTGKGSPTWVNRVEPCWHRRSTGKDREGSWRCRRWPGSTGMGKNELLTPGGQRSPRSCRSPTVRIISVQRCAAFKKLLLECN